MICNFRRKFLLFFSQNSLKRFQKLQFRHQKIHFSRISIENHEFSWKFIPLIFLKYSKSLKNLKKLKILIKNGLLADIFCDFWSKFHFPRHFCTKKHTKNDKKNAIFFVLNWTSCWKSGLSQDNILLIVRVRTEIWNSLF